MKLLLDEMFSRHLSEQLRSRGHDVASIHDADHRWLEGASDASVFTAALDEDRALVTENVADFRRLESDAFANGAASPVLILTSDRRFPRGRSATLGRLVDALDAVLRVPDSPDISFFLGEAEEHS